MKAFALVLLLWVSVKLTLRPDDYTAAVLARAALHVFDPAILTGPLVQLFLAALALYAAALLILRRRRMALAHVYAAALVAGALAVYWLYFDSTLHAENRYYMRTVLLVATPALGMLAAMHVLAESGQRLVIAFPPRIVAGLTSDAMARAVAGALALVVLVHAVETEKFVQVWSGYPEARCARSRSAQRVGPGDRKAQFVSSDRINGSLNRVSWFSTTLFLSVLLAPKLEPARLVINPRANYFWLSCETATENLDAPRAMPTRRASSCVSIRASTAGAGGAIDAPVIRFLFVESRYYDNLWITRMACEYRLPAISSRPTRMCASQGAHMSL